MAIGIYKFTCKSNGKVYVGQSVNVENRYKGHFNNHDNENLKDYQTKFYRALRKHRFENFTFEIIESLEDSSDLDEREIYWVNFYNSYANGYNSNRGGFRVTERNEDHPNAKLTNEQVLEIKEKLKNTKITQYELASLYNITQSEISNINTGKKWSNLGDYDYMIRKEEARNTGSSNPASVFSDEDVVNIRNRYVKESGRKIYEDYKHRCSYTSLERILLGKTYTYLPIYKKSEKTWIK